MYERNLLNHVKNSSFVDNLFECGLLQHGDYSFVRVSPDAIAYIQVGDDSKVLASVEAKTLVDREKIQKAKDCL